MTITLATTSKKRLNARKQQVQDQVFETVMRHPHRHPMTSYPSLSSPLLLATTWLYNISQPTHLIPPPHHPIPNPRIQSLKSPHLHEPSTPPTKQKKQKKKQPTMPLPLFPGEAKTSDSTTAPSNTTASTNTSAGAHSTTTAPQNPAQQQLKKDEQTLSKEEADRLYEERMEEEYAKREGGA